MTDWADEKAEEFLPCICPKYAVVHDSTCKRPFLAQALRDAYEKGRTKAGITISDAARALETE